MRKKFLTTLIEFKLGTTFNMFQKSSKNGY